MEIWYSRGIFVAFRWIWDHTLGLIPVGLIYVFLALIFFLSAFKLIARFKRKKSPPDMGWKRFGRALKIYAKGRTVLGYLAHLKIEPAHIYEDF